MNTLLRPVRYVIRLRERATEATYIWTHRHALRFFTWLYRRMGT